MACLRSPMLPGILRTALTLFLAPTAVWAQLHLIAGTPILNQDEQFETALFRLDGNGAVRKIAELVPQTIGLRWIGVSYDLRKAVILPQGGDPPIVLDLDTATVV